MTDDYEARARNAEELLCLLAGVVATHILHDERGAGEAMRILDLRQKAFPVKDEERQG